MTSRDRRPFFGRPSLCLFSFRLPIASVLAAADFSLNQVPTNLAGVRRDALATIERTDNFEGNLAVLNRALADRSGDVATNLVLRRSGKPRKLGVVMEQRPGQAVSLTLEREFFNLDRLLGRIVNPLPDSARINLVGSKARRDRDKDQSANRDSTTLHHPFSRNVAKQFHSPYVSRSRYSAAQCGARQIAVGKWSGGWPGRPAFRKPRIAATAVKELWSNKSGESRRNQSVHSRPCRRCPFEVEDKPTLNRGIPLAACRDFWYGVL